MLVKVISIIVIARLLDVMILFFSRGLKKRKRLLQAFLLTIVTVGGVGALFVEMPPKITAERQLHSLKLSDDVLRTLAEERQPLKIVKRPYLKGKQVTVIGDSITELDGETIAKVGEIVGYQEVFREQEAMVTSFGYSGATYSQNDPKVTEVKHSSLYDKVVTDKIDFKKSDIVIIFGGTNDVGRGYPLGTHKEENVKTAIGGLRGIIDYIQKDNPQTQIFIFTPIKRVGEEHDKKLVELSQEIMKVGEDYHLSVDNLFLTSGITLANQQEFLYDGLHPNSKGMALIGQEMNRFIEENQVNRSKPR